MTEYNLKILQLIQDRTKDCPITGAEIIRILNIKENPRTFGGKLRDIVNSIRREKFPICASGEGYYYPRNGSELKEYIDSLSKRINAISDARDGLQYIYDQWHMNWILKQQSKDTLEQIKIKEMQPAMV